MESTSFVRVFRTAVFELGTALRSRRAFVTVLLFALIGAGVMYATISGFALLERNLASVLGLPETDSVGSVTMTLWRSKQFQGVVQGIAGDNLIYRDLMGCHPIAIAFAGFIFAAVPMLLLMTVAPAAAGQIRSGAVRYTLLRVSRTEWTFGLFLAEAAVALVALLLLAFAADGVACWRLGFSSGLGLLPALCGWSLRAWVYSLAWLGVFLGVSLSLKSPGKATGLAMLVASVFVAVSSFAAESAPWLEWLTPYCGRGLLWRSSPAVLFEGTVSLAAVAFLYLGLGGFIFSRTDV